jgi:hypothetical protein
MKQIVLFLAFIGVIMIMHGIYQQKIKAAQENVKVEYRFIPRTYYEEQIAASTISNNFKNMFNDDTWVERTVTLPAAKSDRT